MLVTHDLIRCPIETVQSRDRMCQSRRSLLIHIDGDNEVPAERILVWDRCDSMKSCHSADRIYLTPPPSSRTTTRRRDLHEWIPRIASSGFWSRLGRFGNATNLLPLCSSDPILLPFRSRVACTIHIELCQSCCQQCWQNCFQSAENFQTPDIVWLMRFRPLALCPPIGLPFCLP